ncbi:hypothetical protein ACO0LM_19610 [Undibacterium sp. Di26W]|uniref:hypothetical protein n=1 Tax=Undibacterium sp. Di26W TaxID=3413035 RepID=UPI003BF0FC1F
MFRTAGTKAKGDPKFKRRPKLMYVALQLQPDILLDFIRMCRIFLQTPKNPYLPLLTITRPARPPTNQKSPCLYTTQARAFFDQTTSTGIRLVS